MVVLSSFLAPLFRGALTQFAIFALGIMPYITASIIMQILGVVIPRVEQWQQMGAVGQASTSNSLSDNRYCINSNQPHSHSFSIMVEEDSEAPQVAVLN